MKTTARNYNEGQGDFNRLANFLLDHDDHIRAYSTWCIGRFVDWKYGIYGSKRAVPDFCGQNARLWFDGFQQLAGFAISEYGGPNFEIITMPGYRFLFAEILSWALANWDSRGPRLSIEITARQDLEAAVLTRLGFLPKETFYTQALDLQAGLADQTPLEDDFTIVDMATHPDYLAQQVLRSEAFEGRSDLSTAELQERILFYNHNHQGPIYHPEVDLCVMAPDGRFVSGCEALIDARNAGADIERVCTHSSFRRRGFARAVIHECLFRLQAMGLQRAYITGYSEEALNLYGSLGAGEKKTAYIYELAKDSA